MFKISNLECRYKERVIFEMVDFTLSKGEWKSIIGANGIGKSSLLLSMLNISKRKLTEFEINGVDCVKLNTEKIVSNKIYLLTENKGIIPGITVKENMEISSKDNNISELIEKSLNIFPDLKNKLDRYPDSLSGGEKQMLGLAKCSIINPDYLLLDEPTSGLAPKYIDVVYKYLESIKESTGILLVEQNPFLASKYSDKIYTISDRKLIELPQSTDWEKYYL